VSGRTLGWLLWYAGRLQLAEGERAQAEDLWRQLEALAERTRVVTARLCVLQRDITLATVDGQLEDALAQLRHFVAYADESGASVRGRDSALLWLVAPVLYLGRAEAWLAAFDEYTRLVPQASQAWIALTPTRAVCLAHLGRVDEALTVIGPLLDEVDPASSEDQRATAVLVMLLQAAILLNHHAAAVGLSARLARVAHLAINVGSGSPCIARHLGDAAVLLGNRAPARAYYLQALESAGKIRFRPELAVIHMRLAELLLDDGDESDAREHLEVAIPELRDMNMQPGLAHALSLLDGIDLPGTAPPTDVPASALSTVLTGREQEVARLLAAGRTNREIAVALVMTCSRYRYRYRHAAATGSRIQLHRNRARAAFFPKPTPHSPTSPSSQNSKTGLTTSRPSATGGRRGDSPPYRTHDRELPWQCPNRESADQGTVVPNSQRPKSRRMRGGRLPPLPPAR
jgi:tetratricopeptide (TPR) repeat protein